MPELTDRRLQFLYGDLGFDKVAIQEMFGLTSKEVYGRQVHAGIDKNIPSYGDLHRQELEAIAEIIGISPAWTSSGNHPRVALRHEILRAARAGTLDWALVDIAIDEVPGILARARRRSAAAEEIARARALRRRARGEAGAPRS